MKFLSKILLILYLIIVLWLVLFKLSLDLTPILEYQTRSINFIPFVSLTTANDHGILREILYNLAAFIPFGLLLSVNFKKANIWHKLAYILTFSLVIESIQFIFAIGASDVTDILSNTLGGIFGLILYDIFSKFIAKEKLDKFIVITGTSMLVLFLLLRVAIFRNVSYHSASHVSVHPIFGSFFDL